MRLEERSKLVTSKIKVQKKKISLKYQKEVYDQISKMMVYPTNIVFKGYSTFNSHFDYGLYPCFREIIDNFMKMAGKNYYIIDFWFNIYNYYGRVKPHSHRTKNPKFKDHPSKTGVFYYKKPENSGNLIVEKKIIDVEQNDMVVFDSNYVHESQSNKSDDVRIVFSANMMKNVIKVINPNTNKWEMKIL